MNDLKDATLKNASLNFILANRPIFFPAKDTNAKTSFMPSLKSGPLPSQELRLGLVTRPG